MVFILKVRGGHALAFGCNQSSVNESTDPNYIWYIFLLLLRERAGHQLRVPFVIDTEWWIQSPLNIKYGTPLLLLSYYLNNLIGVYINSIAAEPTNITDGEPTQDLYGNKELQANDFV
jgi:hypothetical protein